MIAPTLRKSILQAAISGRLTEQRAEDGDARDLLAAIRKEKTRLVREGKLKKEKALPAITEDEVPFELPGNWCWARLGAVCVSIADGDHQAPPKVSDGIPFLVISNVSSGTISFENCRHVPPEYFEAISYNRCPEYDDLLFTVTGSYGIVVPVQTHKPFCFQRHMALLKTRVINVNYLRFLLDSPLVKMQCDHAVTGTAQKTLALNALKSLLVAIPPLNEQQRIVQRLTSLHEELTALETDEQQLDALETSFPSRMKASILQAAISGQLTEREAGDGDARELLAEIEREKKRLVKEKKIKREKALPPVDEDEVPFEIPENWCWVRLGDIICNHGQKRPDQPFTYIDIGSIDNKKNQLGRLDNIIEPEAAPSRARKIVESGDILFATVRPYLHNICVIRQTIMPEPIASTGFAVLAPLPGIDGEYLFRCLLSPMFDHYANAPENSKGIAYPAIKDAALMRAPIPLPPLAGQRRMAQGVEGVLGGLE